MSRTVSIDVFRLATLSPYFKHFIQSLGQPIDYIPRELEVSFVVFDGMDTEEAIVQCTLFLNLLQDREYEETYSALLIYILQYMALNFIVDVIEYFQINILENTLLI